MTPLISDICSYVHVYKQNRFWWLGLHKIILVDDLLLDITTHDSELQGQEEAGCMQ